MVTRRVAAAPAPAPVSGRRGRADCMWGHRLRSERKTCLPRQLLYSLLLRRDILERAGTWPIAFLLSARLRLRELFAGHAPPLGRKACNHNEVIVVTGHVRAGYVTTLAID